MSTSPWKKHHADTQSIYHSTAILHSCPHARRTAMLWSQRQRCLGSPKAQVTFGRVLSQESSESLSCHAHFKVCRKEPLQHALNRANWGTDNRVALIPAKHAPVMVALSASCVLCDSRASLDSHASTKGRLTCTSRLSLCCLAAQL